MSDKSREDRDMNKECKASGETAKRVLGDKDIPYEVRMKYIIDAYRKDQEKWARLVDYAKFMESEVARLKDVIIANGYIDPGADSVPKSAQVIKELRAQIYELKGSLKELKEAKIRISELEKQVDSFPLRIYKSDSFRRVIKKQKIYIEELQGLLDDNDIPYEPRLPINSLDKEDIDKIVDSALEYKTEYGIEYPPAPAL